MHIGLATLGMSTVLLAGIPARADDFSLEASLLKHIQSCWNMPAGKTARVEVRVTLKPDGSIDKPPVIIKPSEDKALAAYEQSTLRAVLKCEPYNILAEHPDRYGEWSELIITFDPDIAVTR